MQRNDIRIPRAIFPRERYHGRSKLGKSTLQLTVLRVAPCAAIKIREYCLQGAVGDSKIQKIVQGSMPPDPINVHVLCLRKMTMFLRSITY